MFNGAETAVGNDTIHDWTNLDDPPPTCDSTRGYFPVLPEAFADLAGRAPRDSEVALVTYAEGARVRMSFLPFRNLRAADFGSQRAAKAHVRTIAIVVRNPVSPEATVIDALAGKPIRPTHPADLHAQLETLFGK